jgi:hypothetical protein
MKGLLCALLTLAIGGAAKLPLEHHQTQSLRAEKALEPPLNLSLREELGQSFFLATLGGFRSLVATMVEIQAMSAWQENNYGVVDARYAVCNRLQPRDPRYWETRAWHAATNATTYYELRGDLEPTMMRLRIHAQVQKALGILHEAVAIIDDDWNLWQRLADYSSNPRINEFPDHAASAAYWEKCSRCPDAPGYTKRRVGEALANVPGREREAWNLLLSLWYDPSGEHREMGVASTMVELQPKVALLDPTAVLPADVNAVREKLIARRQKYLRESRTTYPVLKGTGVP